MRGETIRPGNTRREETDFLHRKDETLETTREFTSEEKHGLDLMKKIILDPQEKHQVSEYLVKKIISESAPKQLGNINEGIKAMLSKNKTVMMKELGIDDIKDWNRLYESALEFRTQLPEAQEIENVDAA